MPAFGIGREHQEHLQKLMQAQLDYQQREAAYNALMTQALQRAYDVFQDKLAEREEPGRQLTSARALFDLWIDAAEEAYAGVALSPEFREVYGAMVNAQMRLRSGIQREVERVCETFGMPTRTEVDAAHRKIAELERMLRRMRDAAPASGASDPGKSNAAASAPASQSASPTARTATASPAKAAKKASAAKPGPGAAKKTSKGKTL
jgi:class III poly(R)-hydroxyalkanoic acid synthase PhaE subunit